jgi:serine/threonine protein kinase
MNNSSLSLTMTEHNSVQQTTCRLRLGKCLGRGGFSEVFHVDNVISTLVRPAGEDDLESRCVVPSANEFLESKLFVLDGVTKDRIVIKRLKDQSLFQEEIIHRMALVDLRREAKILASLPRHENIVHFLGVSADFFSVYNRKEVLSDAYHEPSQSCFLLLEQVDTTLDKCLERIRNTSEGPTVARKFMFRNSHRHRMILVAQRKRIQEFAVPIANALHFLHKHDIVYRDLKPANCGIAYDPITGKSTVKLLDFGSARPCTGWTFGIQGKYSAGTPRYMSPELMSCNDHGLATDVHSFGILLWQICMLRTPFANGVTCKFLKQIIVTQECRPRLQYIQSVVLQDLLTNCWSTNPTLRPRFHEILLTLQDYIDE